MTAGNQLLKEYNPGNGKLATEVDVDKDPQGSITAAQVVLNSPIVQAGGSIGEVFGSAIGRAIAGNDQFAQLAAGTVVGAIGQSFGTIVAAALSTNLAVVPVGGVFSSFGLNIEGQAGSSVASFLTAEIGTALGLNGFGGQLFDAASGGFAGSVLNQVLQKAPTLGFGGAVSAIDFGAAFSQAEIGIGSALGSILAHQIVQAQTEDGAIGGQVFGAIGSLLGASLIGGATGLAGLALDLVLPGIGSLIGTVLGTVIGDLVGDTPNPSSTHAAEVLPGQLQYSSVFVSNSGGGNTTGSEQLADGVDAIVNAYLGAVGGIGVAGSQTELIGYAVTGSSVLYFEARPDEALYHYFANANDAVNAAALDAVLNTEAIGGNLFLKRVHAHATYSDLATLSGDLQVAQDYERYLDNRDVINALMAANPNTAFTAGWIATFAEASSLGLTQLSTVDFNGGLVGFLHSVKTAGLTFSAANVDLLDGGDGSVTLEIHVGATAAVPGSLVAFASQTNEIDSATGKTIQLAFGNGLATVANFHGPASASLVSGSWQVTAAAGQNLWFGGNDAPNMFNDPQGVSTDDILVGGAQGDVIHGGSGWNYIEGGAGNDQLFGGPNGDILHGGTGSDVLEGGAGNDTYAFNRGDGTDVVFDDYEVTTSSHGSPVTVQADGGSDVLAFGLGIGLADLVFQMSGNDLIVGVRDPANPNAPFAQLTDKITLQNWANPLDRIEYITFADGTFLDISAGIPTTLTVIESSGSTRLVQLNNNYFLDGSTGLGVELKDGGTAFVAGQDGGEFVPLGAEQTASGYEVAWKDTFHNAYLFWTTDADGNHLSNVFGMTWLSGSSPSLEFLESTFQQDLNGDGTIGIPNSTVIESTGSADLIQIGNNYYVLNNGTGASPGVMYGGAPLTVGQFPWTPIAAEQTSTGYEVALKYTGTNLYEVWYTDADGNVLNSANPAVQTIEATFQQDLDGDGFIGIHGPAIESSGSTDLIQADNNYYMFNRNTGTGAGLMYSGAPLTVGQLVWTPIAAEQTSTGYEIVLKYTGTNLYEVWYTDANGNVLNSANPAVQTIESTFQQDLDGDGFIGIHGAIIESSGSTNLIQADNNYYMFNRSTGTGAGLIWSGAPLTVGQPPWTPIAAEQTSTGYEIALKQGANLYEVWYTDANGNVLNSANPAVQTIESTFQQDLDGDGVIGIHGAIIESSGSTNLIQADNNYYMFNRSTGTGAGLIWSGAPLTVGQPPWTPIAAEQTSTGYEIALKQGTNLYEVWYTDANGNVLNSANLLVQWIESNVFHQDLNGDGIIGLPAGSTLIEQLGTTSLVQVGSNFYLDNNSSGSGPELKDGGAAFVVGGNGIVPIGVEPIASGYELAMKDTVHNTFQFWNIDGSGNHTSNVLGNVWVSGGSPWLESQEGFLQQDLNGDNAIGSPAGTTLIETLGSSSLVQIGSNFYLENSSTGSGPVLKYQGSAVTPNEFGATVIALGVEQTSTGYEVAWKNTSNNKFTFWATDSNGNYVSNLTAWLSGGSPLLKSYESVLHQDLNSDGVVGLPAGTTLIESFGSTSLVQVGNNFYLESNTDGSGPEVIYSGAPFTAGQFVWTPIATEQTSTGYEIALKYTGSSLYEVWYTDANGNVLNSTNPLVQTIEPSFQQDLNGDGTIGLPANTTLIEQLGSTSLLKVGNNYDLYNNSSGSGPMLKYGGAAVTPGEFSATITPVGVEQTSTAYEIAWKDSSVNKFLFWVTDSNGNYVSNLSMWVSPTSPWLESQENVLHQDLNNDGVVGLPANSTLIESLGTTSLVQVGNNYYLESNTDGTSHEVIYNGAPLTVGETVWTPFAAEQTSSGYEIALTYPSAGLVTIWNVDANGTVLNSPTGGVAGTSSAFKSYEPALHQDLNGDGLIAIASAGSLELSGTNSPSVQFSGTTGSLILDQSFLFSGQISNFTGNGTLSGSDQIDLKDVSFTSASFSHSFNQTSDVLTVSDGIHSANLHFVGSYTAQNFKFANDGAGGTTVYDPPVSSGAVPIGEAQHQDSFVFNRAATPISPMQTAASDLHDTPSTEMSRLKELLGDYAGHEPITTPLSELATGFLDIVGKGWHAQHDIHVG